MIIRLAIGGFLLWVFSQGSLVFGGTITSAEYFPLADGNSWTYHVTGTNGTYQKTMTVLPGTSIINGVVTKAIQYSDGDVDYATSDKNGIKLHRVVRPSPPPKTTWTFNPPLVSTHGTMNIPETINSSGTVQLIHETAGTFQLNYENTSATEALETLTVPAGTYHTVRFYGSTRIYGKIQGVEVDASEWGNSWAAKHIGLVKDICIDDEGNETWVMTNTNVKPPVRFLPYLPLLLD